MEKDEQRIKKHEDMILQHREANREQHIIKLVSNARAILTNQIGIPLGVLKMGAIITRIQFIRPITEIDLSVFSEYNNKTSTFPINKERLHYNSEYLKQQDTILDELTVKYKDSIIIKCNEIIEMYSNTKKSEKTKN